MQYSGAPRDDGMKPTHRQSKQLQTQQQQPHLKSQTLFVAVVIV